MRSNVIHSENIHIKQLFPLVTKSLAKALSALQKDDSTYSPSAMEQYALNIFSRVSEIDNAFKNMRVTLEYLRKKTYQDSEYNFSEHHAFHVKNFLLRLTSVVDRCYLLAGSTMLMANKKIERLGGNDKVYKELINFSPNSASIIKDIENKVRVLRASRNRVAHNAGYFSKNLFIIQAVENSEIESAKEITNIMSLDKIKDVIIEDAFEQFEKILPAMDDQVKKLIDSLSFFYSSLLEKHITSQ